MSHWIECGEALINLDNVEFIVEQENGGCIVHAVSNHKVHLDAPGTHEQMRAALKFPKERS